MSFDFEKLEVYLKSKAFNKKVAEFLEDSKVSKNKKDQLERAAFSIMLTYISPKRQITIE